MDKIHLRLAAYTRKIENLVENVSQDACPPGTTPQIQWSQPIGSQRSLFFFALIF